MKNWIMAVRPKTLSASISPVILALTLSYYQTQSINLIIAVTTLLCALLLQISSNLINDYFDGIKGTDNKDRLGPTRVTTSGLIKPHEIKKAFIATMVSAAILGLFLVYAGGWPILIIAICSLLCAYLYTGGPYPLSYYGLGEIFAFIFFGPVSVWGTYYLQTKDSTSLVPLIVGMGPGFISATLMSVNNLRDIESDKKAKKHTIASYVGKDFARLMTLFFISSSSFIPVISLIFMPEKKLILLATFSSYLFVMTWKRVLTGPINSDLNKSLAHTGMYMTVYCLMFAVGILL